LGLTLDELKDNNDIIEETGGIKVIYAKKIAGNLNNLTINYSDKWYNKGFYITGGNSCS